MNFATRLLTSILAALPALLVCGCAYDLGPIAGGPYVPGETHDDGHPATPEPEPTWPDPIDGAWIGAPAVSEDAAYVAFESDRVYDDADRNGTWDLFVTPRGGATYRVSLAADGGPADGASRNPSLSADGRFLAFDSDAKNLVASDTNASRDVFVRDLQEGTTVRASVRSDGTQVRGASHHPRLSADGRLVVFTSDARDLAPVVGVAHSKDVYVHDLATGETRRVSEPPTTGAFAPTAR
jgi:Tol biopolymer transport system component